MVVMLTGPQTLQKEFGFGSDELPGSSICCAHVGVVTESLTFTRGTRLFLPLPLSLCCPLWLIAPRVVVGVRDMQSQA
jgi:hypothetical protein